MFTFVNVLVTSPENQEKSKRKRAYGLTIDGARKEERKNTWAFNVENQSASTINAANFQKTQAPQTNIDCVFVVKKKKKTRTEIKNKNKNNVWPLWKK